MRAAVSAAALVAALSLGGAARAGSAASDLLAQATRAAEELRLEESAALLERAWRAGGSDPRQAARILRLAGEVNATMGDRDAALRHFTILVALEPAATLAPGTSPKVTALLDRARAALAGRTLGARVHLLARARGIRVRVDDPLGLVASVRCAGGGAPPRTVAARAELTFFVAAPRDGAVAVELVDRYGNVLVARRAEARWSAAAPASGPAIAGAAPPSARRCRATSAAASRSIRPRAARGKSSAAGPTR